jgi:membrane-associated phospholipid phosphatase
VSSSEYHEQTWVAEDKRQMMRQLEAKAFTRIWVLWSGILALAISLTILIALEDTAPEEGDAIQIVQELPLGTAFPNLVRAATSTELDVVVGAGLAAVLWRTGDRKTLTVLVLLLIALPLMQHGLKLLVDRPRPPFDPADLWSEPGSPSFPSGHVMSATVVYGFLLFLSFRERWAPPYRVLARTLSLAALVLTALTSIYLDVHWHVHWPTDVLGGYLWGLVLLLPGISVLIRDPDTGGCPGGTSPHRT